MTDEYAEWLKAGNHRLSSVGGQPQQHGVGGVKMCGAAATDICVLPSGHDGLCSYNAARVEVRRLQSQVAQLETIAEREGQSADQHQAELAHLRARCASLAHDAGTPLTVMGATVQMGLRHGEISKEIGESLLTEIKRVRVIIQSLDQHATTTQEGTHG